MDENTQDKSDVAAAASGAAVATTPRGVCANCGTALTGEFCSACGQSSEDIRRPAYALIKDLAGSLFAWEGKFFTTAQQLLLRPGAVARAYVDGKRNSFTAPIRLYLIVSLAFFLLMSAADVRVIGVTLTPDGESIRDQDPAQITARLDAIAQSETGFNAGERSPDRVCGVMPGPDEINSRGQLVYARDTFVQIELFEFGASPEGRVLPDNPACENEFGVFDENMNFGAATRFAIQNPSIFEDRVNTAATQSLIFMVLAFALMNLMVHPRRKLIEHVVYSLYWHAIYLPVYAVIILLARLVAGHVPGMITLAVAGSLSVLVLQVLNDRGFYESSWFGAILRSLLLKFLYILSIALLALALIITSV